MTTDSSRCHSSSSEVVTNESENDTSYSHLNDQMLTIRALLSRSIVSSSTLLMEQKISKNGVCARSIALKDKAREQMRDLDEGKRYTAQEWKKLIQEVVAYSHQEGLALELEACRAEIEALRAENDALRSEVDVRRSSFFYKPGQVDNKVTLELDACRAENDALRAQLSDLQDLLRWRDEDTKERRLETTATLETVAMSGSSEAAEALTDEVRTLRDENARLHVGAQRDSYRIEELEGEVWALTSAAKSYRPSAKGSAEVSVDSIASTSFGSSAGSTSFMGSIDEMRFVESSVGTSTGASVGSSGSPPGSPVGSSVGASVASSVGYPTGSLARLRDENARLREEVRRDSKRIEELENKVRMLTPPASVGATASGKSGKPVGSLKMVGLVWVGTSGTDEG
jgi:hypothetical protein